MEVLWNIRNGYFCPFLCSGDLKEMIVNMFTFSRLSNDEKSSYKFSCLAGFDGTSGIMPSVLMDSWFVGTAVGF